MKNNRNPLRWAVPAALILGVLASAQKAAPPAPRFAALVADAKKRVTSIAVDELKTRLDQKIKDYVLIDVREDAEWAQGHLPGAVHLSKGVLERDVEKLVADPGAEIILYCKTGGRSALAADNLQKMGYTKVRNFDGGFTAWVAAGGAVVAP